MLRFIFNFIFFGIIFFLIWKFQPEWIDAMRSWAEAAYDIVVRLVSLAIDKIRALSESSPNGGGA
jgi:hypothetical protein